MPERRKRNSFDSFKYFETDSPILSNVSLPACTCNGYASSCNYEPIKNKGVCITCSNNTAGDNCDTCAVGYFLNPRRANQTSYNTTEPFCLPCNCNPNGTQSGSLTTCDVTTGQCACKERVTQRDCSECRDTFWGLSGDKVLGCDACSCNPIGTVNNTNLCNKTTSQCLCKLNVEGTDCSQCKVNTYNLTLTNPNGCSSCDCDPGASSSSSCDPGSGQCSCLGNLMARDCRLPPLGYYVPRLDAIVLEPESFTSENVVLRTGHGTADATVSGRGFVRLSSGLQTQLRFTSLFNGPMEAVVRFERNASDRLVSLVVNVTSLEGNSCGGVTSLPGVLGSFVVNTVNNEIRGGVVLGKLCMNKGSNYTVNVAGTGPSVLVDSIVFIPDTTAVVTSLSNRLDIDSMKNCVTMAATKVRSARASCASIEYSLMASLLNGSVACSCQSGALKTGMCDRMSGDCDCLPGVLAPDCSYCPADHYQFSLATGCLACSCSQNGSVDPFCDSKGSCTCLPNVQGTKCDACISEYYGLYTKTGCKQCACSPKYSLNNNCDDHGVCLCKPGVRGPVCDGCMDGYYNLTTDGCTQCACNPNGSMAQSCNVNTGSCQCLPSVEGAACSQCKTGFYGLGKWSPNGCFPCFCWGHGQACTSASGWYDTPVSSTWGPSLGTDGWTAENSRKVSIQLQTDQFAMRINQTLLSTEDVYYVAPIKFLGDRKSSYGRYLTVTVAPSNPVLVLDPVQLQVELKGAYINNTLVYTANVSSTSATSLLTYNIPLTELNWQVVTKVLTTADNVTVINISYLGNASYYQFQGTLANLAALSIRGYKGNVTNSSLDMISVVLDGATFTNIPGSGSVNNVELCTCQKEYTGTNCQKCANGYTRVFPNSTDPSGQCVPCNCNGHGVTCTGENCSTVAAPCDPDTGVCTCQHNTKGDHCEVCMQGYYGNPLRGTPVDCAPCSCPGVITANATNAFATSCTLVGNSPVCQDCKEGHTGNACQVCKDGYFGTPENITNFGGACRQCQCNGRASTCDTRTGNCSACQNNTAGQNCELCASGYYGDGDPLTLSCKPCTCQNMTGSSGLCDHKTGVCQCLPNVYGPACDVCENESFNLTAGRGCELCNCNTNGSTSTVCDKITGQCQCRALVTGRLCDQCQATYWNVNPVTGCDSCQCNATGTAKFVNGTAQDSCDVRTGQCVCASAGIVGRTCNACSPVSKYTFQYVHLFNLGAYPDCTLCGECFDSWGQRIDELGKGLDEMDDKVDVIWSQYNNQSREEVKSALARIEEKINQTDILVANFESISKQLQRLQVQFSEAFSRLTNISTEIEILTQSDQHLATTLNSLVSDVVGNSSTTTLSSVRTQLDNLILAAQATILQGNKSWSEIQALSFVVASPEDKKKQLQDQGKKLMDLANLVNVTYISLKSLYETSLISGVDDRGKNINTTLEKLANISNSLQEVASTITQIQQDAAAADVSVRSLIGQSTKTRSDILDAVMRLQQYVVNATGAQNAADKALKDALSFKTLAVKAENTMKDSMTAILENIASITQAQSDLINAQSLSLSVQLLQMPVLADMQVLVQQISTSNVSQAAVDSLNIFVKQALYNAGEAVNQAQKTLTKSRELNQEIQQMKADVATSRDLRNQVETTLIDANALNTTINNILQNATDHSFQVDANVSTITQLAKGVQADIKNLSSCINQQNLDANNAATAANQAHDKAATVSNAQIKLIQVVSGISTQESSSDITLALTNLTQADAVMKKVEDDFTTLKNFAILETLVQALVNQSIEATNLDKEITQLTAELDIIIISLDKYASGAVCNNV
ncbi:laminin subunit beta-1-like [Physella acuta]|uniref:laminin subunit beta-1-like n=1 Tax=Physella acuta TaxID=109671 RepID=UPI0027DE2F64|nr:laminin subunit beta-1-like [Physella acuta]